MKRVFLADNRSCSDDLRTEHGLSVYVETDRHKMLLDTGASDLFITNAEKQGIDLGKVDYVFISHGHADHIGGLPFFLRINSWAKIIMSPYIIGGYYVSKRNHEHSITTDICFDDIRERLILADRNMKIDDEIEVIAEIPYEEDMPAGNCNLFCRDGSGELVRDDFVHETAVRVGDLLFSGCAHHGIINILKSAPRVPAYVIGGFHLLDAYETNENIRHITDVLKNDYPDTMFYTGHCTGNDCINALKDKMDGRLDGFCLGYHIPDVRIRMLENADDDTTARIQALVRQLSITAELPSKEFLNATAQSDNSEIFVMTYDGLLIGMAVLCRCMMPTGIKYWIEDVTIDKNYRGRHLGKRLVNHLTATLPQHSQVMLTSRPSRVAANAMYQRLGFKMRETNVYKKEM